MKKFEVPVIEISTFDIIDVITTSDKNEFDDSLIGPIH